MSRYSPFLVTFVYKHPGEIMFKKKAPKKERGQIASAPVLQWKGDLRATRPISSLSPAVSETKQPINLGSRKRIRLVYKPHAMQSTLGRPR
jgi:hypothetical protein